MTVRTLVAHRGGALLVAAGLGLVALLAVLFLSSPQRPASAVAPEVPVDFSISVGAAAGNSNECNSSGTPTAKCLVAAATTFVVTVSMNGAISDMPGGDYEGFTAFLEYMGVTSDGTYASVDPYLWPDCKLTGIALLPGLHAIGCAIGIGVSGSTYVGAMASAEFTCTEDGAVTLQHGANATSLFDEETFMYAVEGEGTAESLTINCVDPLAYPGDTDGDGCPDANEAQTGTYSEQNGGRRNWLNPWDYFNSLGDGQNRTEDLLWVLYHYFVDEGDMGYTEDVDRSYVGPDPWDLGPPDGLVRIEDILFQRDQTWHDCS